MYKFTVCICPQGLNAALFYENKNQKEYISLIPTSAHTGDGMGNLVALICELCQSMLARKLMWSQMLQAVVMEVSSRSYTMGQIWATLTPNGTNQGLFKISFQYILTRLYGESKCTEN